LEENNNIRKQRIIMLLGRPGMGKSLFLLELIRQMETNQNLEFNYLTLKNYNKFVLLEK